ncbi:MAG: cysteine desulfurase family protein [Clostridia bacterium]|nr:cysteine desulfurase family protein [Clostridia bacterium]
MIYLDHAATSPLRREALQAMLPFFSEDFGNASAGYAAGRKARAALERARMQTAQAIGAQRQEIYLTSGGSEADNWALFGVAGARPGRRRIVVSSVEHHAVLRACEALESRGAEVIRLGVSQDGQVDPEEAARAITEETALVSVMLANNEVGTIEPVAAIAKLAHAKGTLMHTDAVQAIGQIPVNVGELGVDLLSLSAHKFGGPKGIGALYIKSGTRIDSLIYGGEQERGLRAGTENVPLAVGMGEAIAAAASELEQTAARERELRERMIALCLRLPGVRLNGSRVHRLPGNVHLSIRGMQSALLVTNLDMRGIAASAGSACAAGSIERSHVLEAMFPKEAGWADLRLTLGPESTQEDVSAAAAALSELLHRGKGEF